MNQYQLTVLIKEYARTYEFCSEKSDDLFMKIEHELCRWESPADQKRNEAELKRLGWHYSPVNAEVKQ